MAEMGFQVYCNREYQQEVESISTPKELNGIYFWKDSMRLSVSSCISNLPSGSMMPFQIIRSPLTVSPIQTHPVRHSEVALVNNVGTLTVAY